MPKLKDSMDEVYREKQLSDRTKRSVLEKAKGSTRLKRDFRLNWQPMLVSIGFVAVLLLFSITMPNDETAVTSSTQLAPFDADDAVLDRITHFLEIVEDGIITDEERRHYVMTSDWAVQLAMDTGKSVFYNRPDVTKEQATLINTLLARMYEMVREAQPSDEVVALENPYSFSVLLKDLPRWNETLEEFSDKTYVSSLAEKPVSEKKIFGLEWYWQLGIIGFLLLFIYLFIQNIRYERNKLFFVFHIVAILYLITPFSEDSNEYFGYDETSIVEAMQEFGFSSFEWGRLELLDIAEFDDVRYGLVRNRQGGLMISAFEKHGNRYVIGRSGSQDSNSELIIGPGNIKQMGQTNFDVVGINKDTHIVGVTVNDGDTQEGYYYPVEPTQTKIYLLQYPNGMMNFSMDIQYEEGSEPEE